MPAADALRKVAGLSRAAASLCIGLMLLALQLALAGCATPHRLPAVPAALAARAQPTVGPYRYLVARDSSGFAEEARNSFRREQAWRASTGQTGPLPPVSLLAISGGGDDGAFGAGLLTGWTAAGTRPEFKVVTGVSTGALIAPFAFLGPKYDPALTAVYTEISQKDIFKKRNLLSGILGDALSDTTPLNRLIARYVDQSLLDAIAAEYAKGRLLLVGTTNLDSMEPVIWNMTALAASKEPHARELFRKILVASAAIPAAFPPVMIDVQVDGTQYQEMHVDGGAMAQVFAYPPSLNVAAEAAALGVASRQRTLYVIRNARLDPDWASVKRQTMPIATRAVSSLMQTQGIGDLYRIFATTQRDGIDFNLAYVPATFTVPHREQFDPTYMRELFKTGRAMAVAGFPWHKYPPGYAAPVLAQRAAKGAAAVTSPAVPAQTAPPR